MANGLPLGPGFHKRHELLLKVKMWQWLAPFLLRIGLNGYNSLFYAVQKHDGDKLPEGIEPPTDGLQNTALPD